jgi:putative copper resistance protein D
VPDALSVICRAISFVLLLQAAGVAVFLAAFGQLLPASLSAARRLGLRLAIAAMALVGLHFALEAARMAGEMGAVFDLSMQQMAWESPAGKGFVTRVVGLALIAIGLRASAGGLGAPAGPRAPDAGPRVSVAGDRRSFPWLAIAGALLAVSAFTFSGHTVTTSHRMLADAALCVHLLVVSFWLGALLPLRLAALRELPATADRLVDSFSRVALWVVPLIALAGAGMMLILLPDLTVFARPYGELLLWKIALFLVLMVLAALNKWRFGRGIGRAEPAAVRAFRRTVVIEYVLICAVLAVTAVMTTFYSPEAA